MSKRPVSFTRPSPGRSIEEPLSNRERRNQMRHRLHLPADKPRLFIRGITNGEDLLIAGAVFFITFLGTGAWLAI